MRAIGTIKFVQIQRSQLKTGEAPRRVYSPAPLLTVAQLRLTPDGIIGLTDDGQELIDVHNANHPDTRNKGANSISLGFTGHYGLMQQRFGDHLCEGCAGENIIIDSSQVWTSEDLGDTLIIQRKDSGEQITLKEVFAAPPCDGFSRFALNNLDATGAQVRETLLFLSEGVRGFYATLDGESGIIAAGDTVYALR